MSNLYLKIKNRVSSLYTNNVGMFIRKFHAPKPPLNFPKEILIHIGCGELNDKRYINIDARAFQHVHKISEDISLKDFENTTIDLVYACHVLEHISHTHIEGLLKQWHIKLKKDGVVRISVPDFDHIVSIYKDNQNDISTIQKPLMGGQEYPTNFHMIAFNYNFLQSLLIKAGFQNVRRWEPASAKFHAFDDWSGRTLLINNKNYPISLNIEATK